MRLKHIKLAGFKSFVDPTKVPFEQQMTSIVGPNGCGKSNIIDAVRWVLGESSAKNLRGDAMTDVIFNGAASRKPVGQASVELLFDNTDGRIQGSMADRSQVSIRRVINRESQNTYYLNGSKCRRRDITDIFLGTGLGPRSYAIIEQGTISKLIESKPQELRIFIEEAAGISKYKERRRDTENRIRHTRENLERLNDIRLELGLQIDKLHQQAEAAKRFKTLKTKERRYRAELAALKWQKFEQQTNEQKLKISEYQTEIEALVVEQKQIEIKLYDAKQQITIGGESGGELHQKKLLLSNNIARSEQNIKHLKQQKQKAQNDNTVTQQQLINAQKVILAEQEKLQQCTVKLNEQQPELEVTEQQLAASQETLDDIVELQRNEHQQWQALQVKHKNANDHRFTINQKISEISAQLKQQSQREVALKELLHNSETDEHLNRSEKISALKAKLLTQENQQHLLEQRVIENEQQQKECSEKISQLAQQQAQNKGEISALTQTLTQLKEQDQQADWSIAQKKWLNLNNLESLGSVYQSLEVETGWQASVEHVLQHCLQGELVEHLPEELAISPLFLVPSEKYLTASGNTVSAIAGSLAEKAMGVPAITLLLNNIMIADNYQQARKLLPSLLTNQSIICQDGTWLSHSFIRKGNIDNHSAVLQLAQNISLTEQKLSQLQLNNKGHQAQENTFLCEYNQFIGHNSTLQKELKLIRKQHNSLQQEIALAQQAQQHREKQSALYQREINDLSACLITSKQALSAQEVILAKLPKHDPQELMNLSIAQESLQNKIQHNQGQIQQLNQNKHQQVLVIEKLTHEQTQGQISLVRAQESIQQLTQQQKLHQKVIEESTLPLQVDEQKLQSWLIDITKIDEKISKLHQDTTGMQTVIAEAELNAKQILKKISNKTEQINAVHLSAESYRLRADAALEQLKEMQQNLKTVLESMPEQAKEALWQAHIINLGKDINRLGAINLAAINEYQSQLERKTYLDQQDEDLTQAINTLELAIAKIDKESRYKFKETFDKINNDLKALFPKVFGGGNAYLALTDDDMLETGVTIMARPPGKKNSTIHLLSGGEKALTALSLVFAIFRLNPAPFCMLDEVDAPLDDANVSRFCNLVREMSQTVQFIYISHNKIAMEMASQLTGVTMFEPGVSRMVAVDIDEAIAMAEIEST